MKLQCPNCKSFKTTNNRNITAGVGFALLIFGGLFSWLIFPLAFAFLGIVMLLISACMKPTQGQCNACRFKWNL